MNLNKLFLIGRVTRDPELKSLPSGTVVAKFGLATNHNYTEKSGEKKQTTQFHNCVAFGRPAEIIAQFITKGQEMCVEGRIEYRQWEKKDGGKGVATEIVIDSFQMGSKSKGLQDLREENFGPIKHDDGGLPQIDVEENIKAEDLPF